MQAPTERMPFRETVEVSGHVIDSLILPKILDAITSRAGSFIIQEFTVGQNRTDPSYVLLEVLAETPEKLADILEQISDHGAVPISAQDCNLEVADLAGCFPEGFYSTTHHHCEVRLDGHWFEVDRPEMDCGIKVDPGEKTAICIPMVEVKPGDQIIVGHAGVRVFPEARDQKRRLFEFMGSEVSTEKPKGVAFREVAMEMLRAKEAGKEVLLVGGPAIVHTGSGDHLNSLIRGGYIHRLFAGNALATHDIEQALFGTSLGVNLNEGISTEGGHEHHLRAINRIRRVGGIKQAVEEGLLTQGIMYECVINNVPYLLAGSIRDDGPLPEVITDTLEAQKQMREQVQNVGFALMIATTLHSIAVGNLLPGTTKVVCVDINPSTVIKLSDRGSIQTVGLVTDVEPFLRSLVQELKQLTS
ncbi:putative lysine-oxoglutarate reductase/saccharopine dehydrogenase [Planctomycetales bacterium 10988]|nr:putative lysine-oxoglutarate reductase/saccharopine dehydrogenase [Planctomycetales bacterium 10988]